ncbi:MAG: hypothetical protein M1308_24140 [Actinobacteria bacterium]|nr:hypothetical protein [Actinomycetota bacterium]
MNKNILFLLGDLGASAYYRMKLPASALKNLGYSVTVAQKVNAKEMVVGIDTFMGTYHKSLYDYDVIIFQLVWHDWLLPIIARLTLAGKTTAMELDDDYYNLPPSYSGFLNMHPRIETYKEGKLKKRKQYFELDDKGQVKNKQFTFWQNGQRFKGSKPIFSKVNNAIEYLRDALESVSIIQVSTPELAELYGPKSVVLENCIDNDNYRDISADKNHELPVIGWYGAKARIEDLRLVKGAIPDNTRLFVGGADKEAREIFGDIDTIGFFKPDEIPQVIARCDIGLCPLQDYKFNAGKSDLKGLEFGAGFVPVVASDVAPYRRWVKRGVNGFIAKNGKDWVRYLKLLAGDKDLRIKMAIEAKKCAIERDIKNNIWKYIDTYNLTKESKCQVLESV